MKYKQTRTVHVYVDLDHTMLDTDGIFYGALWETVSEMGVSSAQWDALYCLFGSHGMQFFEACTQLTAIGLERSVVRNVTCAVRKRFSDLSSFVFSDVIPFIQRVRTQEGRVIVVTRGNIRWQRTKIRATSLERSVDTVLTVEGEHGKSYAIARDLPVGARALFIDNNHAELEEVMTNMPHIAAWAVNRVPKSAMEPESAEAKRWRKARAYALGLSGDYPRAASLEEIVL